MYSKRSTVQLHRPRLRESGNERLIFPLLHTNQLQLCWGGRASSPRGAGVEGGTAEDVWAAKATTPTCCPLKEHRIAEGGAGRSDSEGKETHFVELARPYTGNLTRLHCGRRPHSHRTQKMLGRDEASDEFEFVSWFILYTFCTLQSFWLDCSTIFFSIAGILVWFDLTWMNWTRNAVVFRAASCPAPRGRSTTPRIRPNQFWKTDQNYLTLHWIVFWAKLILQQSRALTVAAAFTMTPSRVPAVQPSWPHPKKARRILNHLSQSSRHHNHKLAIHTYIRLLRFLYNINANEPCIARISWRCFVIPCAFRVSCVINNEQ